MDTTLLQRALQELLRLLCKRDSNKSRITASHFNDRNSHTEGNFGTSIGRNIILIDDLIIRDHVYKYRFVCLSVICLARQFGRRFLTVVFFYLYVTNRCVEIEFLCEVVGSYRGIYANVMLYLIL